MNTLPQDWIRDLPPHLEERTRLAASPAASGSEEFVLYWMHHAVRADENPALDVAQRLSDQLQLPLLVYQAISERAPYASDRRHAFLLEGAHDAQQQFRERDVNYVFHLERPGHRGPHLRQLCDRAAVMVTEETSVRPFPTWLDRLSQTAATPLLCVDTACIAPMPLVGKAYERAFEFRKATQTLYRERLLRPWPNEPARTPIDEVDLPFEPLRLDEHNLADLVAECEIDHAIAPVPHTTGGSAAGYARWNRFRDEGLHNYAKLRNNPLADGVSRLSPYLHFGMVSPFRIARETAQSTNNGGEKFLDELLIWRELAYAFCFYRGDHESLSALPAWAQETLAIHETDHRPALHSWETLARARTGDALWDAAQRSLLMHGELHNNVRMTWGKALLNWTPDATTALAMMIDLNHRYALDGCDPASYGGILWCLGQFDRAFPPARAILGTVRDRATKEHAKRLDVAQYAKRTSRPLYEPALEVAVIGAGLSGLVCARTLADHGLRVVVFEKSRGVGGRMATRRTTEGPQFDHGAQYFTVRDQRFQRYVQSWMQDGVVARWEGRLATLNHGRLQWKTESTPRYVGVPGMNAICRHLAQDLDIRFRQQVAPPRLQEHRWRLTSRDGVELGEFDRIILSAPAPQTAELLAAAPKLQKATIAATMQGCWAVLLAFEHSLELPFDGAFVHDSPLSWIARNDTKPGRGHEDECWVLHASPEWTTQCLEDDPEKVLSHLTDAFWLATGAIAVNPVYATTHRWRYAIPPEPLKHQSLFDAGLGIGACGDWCGGPRVEGAFLSGMSLAGRVLASLPAAK